MCISLCSKLERRIRSEKTSPSDESCVFLIYFSQSRYIFHHSTIFMSAGYSWRAGLGISKRTLWSEGLVKLIFVFFFVLSFSTHFRMYKGLMEGCEDILFGHYQDFSEDSCWEIYYVTYRRRTILLYIWKIRGS